MLTSKVVLLSLALFILAFLGSSHTIQEHSLPGVSSPNIDTPSTGRLLQAVPVNSPQINAAVSKIISDSNSARKNKGKPALSVNSSLQQIIKQWAVSLKGRMSLSQYMQLYGIHSSQSYTFASVPLDYLVDVVQKASPALANPDFTTVAIFSRPSDGQNYEIIVVLQGGYDAIQSDLSKDVVLKIINDIESQRPKTGKNETVDHIQKNPTPNVTQKPAPKNDSTTIELPPNSKATQNDKKPPNKESQPLITVQSKSQQVKKISSQPKAQPKQQTQQSQPKQQPKVEQKPILQSEPLNRPSSQIVENINKPSKTNQQVKDQIQKPVQQITETKSNNSQQQVVSPKPQTIAPITILPPFQIIPPPKPISYSPPVKEMPSAQASTKTPRTPLTPSNNPSFKNIVLTHSVPSTFVKNEAFPFKGYITVPNPSGVKVNVIFARVTDQKRMSFNTYLPPNTTDFEVLAILTISGSYYLSIFIGGQGSTSLSQYTVIPSFFGQITTRSPAPLNDVALDLRGNDLWLTWNSTESTLPALTQIIFSQQNGANIQFLLSNYKTSMQIPYAQFTSFSAGITTISIAQAFSSTESAAARTSDFSAPYNIIFNATTHNFAKFTGPKFFQPIPYRIDADGSINLKGIAPTGGLQNQVILLSPSKHFLIYNLTNNNKNKYVNAGVNIDIKIPLQELGNYIFEVNNAVGQAVINMPIYVGDIYPLLPDFIDLSPASPDSAALNDPSDLESRRSIITELINAVRSKFGAPNIYLDNNLNNLAQNYSSKLIQQQFFSHTDSYGNNPGTRAKTAGIFQKICQNLAINSNLTQAQLMLQRSPAHLRNMVDPAWTRVGLGIVQNSNQVYYLTQQFSSRDMTLNPLTNNELILIQKSILNYIQSQFPYLKTQNKQLSIDLSGFQLGNSDKNVVAYLNGLGYSRFDIDEVQISYNAGSFMGLFAGKDYFQPSKQYGKVGVSVIYKEGNLLIQAAYD